jgi:hypothetical protein
MTTLLRPRAHGDHASADTTPRDDERGGDTLLGAVANVLHDADPATARLDAVAVAGGEPVERLVPHGGWPPTRLRREDERLLGVVLVVR